MSTHNDIIVYDYSDDDSPGECTNGIHLHAYADGHTSEAVAMLCELPSLMMEWQGWPARILRDSLADGRHGPITRENLERWAACFAWEEWLYSHTVAHAISRYVYRRWYIIPRDTTYYPPSWWKPNNGEEIRVRVSESAGLWLVDQFEAINGMENLPPRCAIHNGVLTIHAQSLWYDKLWELGNTRVQQENSQADRQKQA